LVAGHPGVVDGPFVGDAVVAVLVAGALSSGHHQPARVAGWAGVLGNHHLAGGGGQGGEQRGAVGGGGVGVPGGGFAGDTTTKGREDSPTMTTTTYPYPNVPPPPSPAFISDCISAAAN